VGAKTEKKKKGKKKNQKKKESNNLNEGKLGKGKKKKRPSLTFRKRNGRNSIRSRWGGRAEKRNRAFYKKKVNESYRGGPLCRAGKKGGGGSLSTKGEGKNAQPGGVKER